MNTTVQKETKSWTEFYRGRMNARYKLYFRKRYGVMIDYIVNRIQPNRMLEEGIGIGNLSYHVDKESYRTECFGYDISKEMVDLSIENTTLYSYQDDIMNPSMLEYQSVDLISTHGVLEHFSDEALTKIRTRYDNMAIPYIHYVPLDKYVTPSFGDERLLPYQFWLNMFKPTDYVIFNSGKDLLFINSYGKFK